MAHHGRTFWAALAALATLAAACLLQAVPEAVRWALLICALGFVGATLRLRRIDAGL